MEIIIQVTGAMIIGWNSKHLPVRERWQFFVAAGGGAAWALMVGGLFDLVQR